MYFTQTLAFLSFPLMVLICYFGATYAVKKLEEKESKEDSNK